MHDAHAHRLLLQCLLWAKSGYVQATGQSNIKISMRIPKTASHMAETLKV